MQQGGARATPKVSLAELIISGLSSFVKVLKSSKHIIRGGDRCTRLF